MVDQPPAPPEFKETQLQSSGATPTEVIRQQANTADYIVLRFAVLGLIVAILGSLVGVVFLTITDHSPPDGIIAMGSASVGALATMLVRPPLVR